MCVVPTAFEPQQQINCSRCSTGNLLTHQVNLEDYLCRYMIATPAADACFRNNVRLCISSDCQNVAVECQQSNAHALAFFVFILQLPEVCTQTVFIDCRSIYTAQQILSILPEQGSSRGPFLCHPESLPHTVVCLGAAAASGSVPPSQTGPAASNQTCSSRTAP